MNKLNEVEDMFGGIEKTIAVDSVNLQVGRAQSN
jgi:hypothetical protein